MLGAHTQEDPVAEDQGKINVVDEVVAEVITDEQLIEDEVVASALSIRKHVTVRAMALSIVVGFALAVITLKLSLTTGVIPSLNIAAGLMSFVGLSSALQVTRNACRFAGDMMELTKQEVVVAQTAAVALQGMAFTLGFGSYFFAMSEKAWEQTGSIPSQAKEVVPMTMGVIVPYAFCVGFTGIFVLVVLRNKYILELEGTLVYPSGTATATMINSFFAEGGRELAKKQFQWFTRWFAASFGWDFFAWFFSGGDGCGFNSFPTLGLKALEWTWQFDFTWNYVAVGMLMPYIVSLSFLYGAILCWGILWPILSAKEGDWYPAGLSGSSLQGLLGYKVFIAIALILGDALYGMAKMAVVAFRQYRKSKRAPTLQESDSNGSSDEDEDEQLAARDKRIRQRIFRSAHIPAWMTFAMYAAFTVLGTIVIPLIFTGTMWYVVLVAYLLVPVFAIPNSYITGLTDWDLSSTFGKLVIFVMAVWSNSIDPETGIVAGLAACGVVFVGTSQSSTLMQDLRTGYLTGSSPNAMLLAQIIGTIFGCVLAPAAFMIFNSAFDLGNPDGPYKNPYGVIYRSMAIVGTEGVDALPKHCLELCAGFFAMSLLFAVIRDMADTMLPESSRLRFAVLNFFPMPLAMAIPAYIGANLAISVCVGAIVKIVWSHRAPKHCERFHVAFASGVIAGDGLWALPSAFLALGNVNPPVCMQFVAGS